MAEMPVPKELIRAARRADLYNFLLEQHPDEVEESRKDRNSLWLKDNHSISIKRGYTGYTDWATGETGNSLDLLVRHLGYNLTDAVLALTGTVATLPVQRRDPPRPTMTSSTPELPAPYAGRYRQLLAYLTQTRGLPIEAVQQLIDRGLLYQDAAHNNAVFVNAARTYAEIRGTLSSVPYHALAPNSDYYACWWFVGGPDGISIDTPCDTAMVFESAIDAISLYAILHSCGDEPVTRYCSIGGVGNQQRIDLIRQYHRKTILAVDNDAAGRACLQRNPALPTRRPKHTDFTADLLAINAAAEAARAARNGTGV